MNSLHRVVDSLKTRGARRTAQTIVSVLGDRWFDWRYGTETSTEVALEPLHVVQPAAALVQPDAVKLSEQYRPGTGPMGRLDYQPARTIFFRKLLRRVDVSAAKVFVDLGCGKGRTLLMAAQSGFRRAAGVDFSHDLCNVARQNVDIFLARTGLAAQIEIFNADVANYAVRDDDDFFFVSPFGGAVLKRILDNIAASRARAPRKIWFIYYNPYTPEIIDAHPDFVRIDGFAYGGGEALIYSTRQASLRYTAAAAA